jgi:hypothetical protein
MPATDQGGVQDGFAAKAAVPAAAHACLLAFAD